MNALIDRLKGDKVIWMVAILLMIVSLLAVFSAIPALAYRKHDGRIAFLVLKHAVILVMGAFIIYYTHRFKFKYWARLSVMAVWLVAGLLVLTLFVGNTSGGATRWLTVPVIGQSFQTSDLAKVVLIIFVARILTVHREELRSFTKGTGRVLLPVLVVCGLILPMNFSTAFLLFAVCMALMFVGKVPIKHLLLINGIAVLGFVFLLLAAKAFSSGDATTAEGVTNGGLLPRLETWIARVENFGNGDSDGNYQADMAKVAIASGGLAPGLPGTASSKYILPESYSDMIYAYIIEEYGSILGGVGVLLLYLILLFRSVRIYSKCESRFGGLVAIGLCLMIVLQAMTNMAVSVNLIPVTGQTLPLVSHGGTSMWFTCLAIGIILSVSRTVTAGSVKSPSKDGLSFA